MMLVGFLNFFMVYTYGDIGRAPEYDTSDSSNCHLFME
jgi:hypothetical protein